MSSKTVESLIPEVTAAVSLVEAAILWATNDKARRDAKAVDRAYFPIENVVSRLTDAEAKRLCCGECQGLLVRTKSYFCCPQGHGKLIRQNDLLAKLVGFDPGSKWVGEETLKAFAAAMRKFSKAHDGWHPRKIVAALRAYGNRKILTMPKVVTR